jgi:hypothetical protein
LWNKKDAQRSIIDPVLKEIDELRLAFHDFSFSYVSRVCNKVLHTLAKQVSGSHRLETWYVTLTCVYDLIILRLRPADNKRQASKKKQSGCQVFSVYHHGSSLHSTANFVFSVTSSISLF